MKEKWTPGPWRVSADIPNEYMPWSGAIAIEGDIDGGAVTPIICYTTRGDGDNLQADSWLIAAAPELYAALSALVEYHQPNSEAYERAHLALAKARGDAT